MANKIIYIEDEPFLLNFFGKSGACEGYDYEGILFQHKPGEEVLVASSVQSGFRKGDILILDGLGEKCFSILDQLPLEVRSSTIVFSGTEALFERAQEYEVMFVAKPRQDELVEKIRGLKNV